MEGRICGPSILFVTMKKEILVALSVLLVVVIVGCGLWIGYYVIDSYHQKETYKTLAEKFVINESTPSITVVEGESSSVEEPPTDENTEEDGLSTPPRHDLAALREENPDCVGWISIPDTTVDYPVVWTPSEPEHYLRRDFYGTYASGGTPFLDGRNAAQASGQNLIIYGHNILDGSMFKPILQYLMPNFQVTHTNIYLELNGAQYRYEVVATLETDISSPIYTYTDLEDQTEMEEFCSLLLEETGQDPVSQAEGYLTLSTCNDQGGNSRVLIIAALTEDVNR